MIFNDCLKLVNGLKSTVGGKEFNKEKKKKKNSLLCICRCYRLHRSSEDLPAISPFVCILFLHFIILNPTACSHSMYGVNFRQYSTWGFHCENN